MIQNYLKIAFRNLWRNRGYSFINIFGLAVGLAGCIVIVLYVTHELSYDTHHEHSDRIYRVIAKIDFSGNYMELAPVPAPMGPTLQRDYPEVEAMVRLRPRGSHMVKKGDSNIKESGIVFSDPEFFDVFTLPVVHGNPETALTDPYSAVITKSMARKYFEKTDIVGESLVLNDRDVYEITAVVEDMPVASHFHFNLLLSMSTIDEAENGVWLSNNFRTYILLREGSDPAAFERHFETIKKTYVEPQIRQFMGVGLDEFEEVGNSLVYELQPLTDIHLYSDLTGEFEPNGSMAYVAVFTALAIFILLLACINFMNLATARSAKRAREVGVRKTLGSMQRELTLQFFIESFLYSVLAFLAALLLVEISLPLFSELAGRPIESDYLGNPWLAGLIVSIVLATGLLAGSYPALMLSSFKPVEVLKGTFTERSGHGTLRKGLVVFQFSVSIIILIGLLVVNKQLDFIRSRDLGFDRERIVILNDAYALGDTREAVETFRDRMLDYPVFRSATISGFFPVDGYSKDDRTYWPKGQTPSEDNTVNMQRWRVDEKYIPTLGMEIVEGRNFSEELDREGGVVILNEAAVDRFGFDEPLGKVITIYGSNEDGSIDQDVLVDHEIVGVVKNFHYESLRENITPLGLFYGPSFGNMAFRIASTGISDAVELLESHWKEQAPGQPFSYSFMDSRFDRMYRAETGVQDLMAAFSGLAVLIACLGLLGLSAYSVERRTKEIGIRKVLGAGVGNILGMVSGEFLKLVLLSIAISVPVAYLAMSRWLQEFAYRTELGYGVFIVAGIGTLVVALATVSWQSVRAALMDPVQSLRNE